MNKAFWCSSKECDRYGNTGSALCCRIFNWTVVQSPSACITPIKTSKYPCLCASYSVLRVSNNKSPKGWYGEQCKMICRIPSFCQYSSYKISKDIKMSELYTNFAINLRYLSVLCFLSLQGKYWLCKSTRHFVFDQHYCWKHQIIGLVVCLHVTLDPSWCNKWSKCYWAFWLSSKHNFLYTALQADRVNPVNLKSREKQQYSKIIPVYILSCYHWVFPKILV